MHTLLQMTLLATFLATTRATSPDMSHISRFNNEGLSYITQVKLIDHSLDRGEDLFEAIQAAQARMASGGASTPATPAPGGTLRVTFEGHLYSDSRDLNLTVAPSSSSYSIESPSVRERRLAIFGSDTRVNCPPSTSGTPWSAIGEVTMSDSQGRFICSGAMVGVDTVLTAAHCVYSRSQRAFFATLDFSPGQFKAGKPFGAIPWNHVTIYSSYATSGSSSSDPNVLDIAIIKLSQPIGLRAGWMGIKAPCQQPAATGSFTLVTAGYPQDKPFGTCVTASCRVTVSSCTEPYLYHTCPTINGQSGSAMWDLSTGVPLIRAVHNLEWQGSGGSSVYNSAVAITPQHFQSIVSWIGATGKPQIGLIKEPPVYP